MLMKTLKRAGLGFLLGMAVGNVIAFISGLSSTGEVQFMSVKLIELCGGEPLAFLIQTLLSGLIGLSGFAGMTLYDLEKWSMVACMGTHFTICMLTFLPCAYLLYWINSWEELLVMTGIMAAAYILIWLIMCAVYRAQVKKLNILQSEKLHNVNDTAA
ncbi:MAG: DUF3021 domain-containing protein [Ruminiclostridium sp.]|nr:DUF3021 domain-containing protein [Ruminiclostridium sp.]